MDKLIRADERLPDIRVGARALLLLLGQRYLVTITDVGNELLQTTFPGEDYPIEGRTATFEFHDTSGFNAYTVRVIGMKQTEGGGLVVERPKSYRRNFHRTGCRVPTDLTVQVRDVDTLRSYDAALLDLSSGGGRIETRAPLEANTIAQTTISLPEEPVHQLTARVIHVNDDPEFAGRDGRVVGLRFIDPSEDARGSISRYARRRMDETTAPPTRWVRYQIIHPG